MYYLYIVRSSDDRLYIGITENLNQRIKQHQSGNGAMYTKNFFGARLVYFEKYKRRIEVESREKQIKRWTRAKKEALIKRDFILLQQLSKS